MATLHQRLHRMGVNGYDVIHLETNSNMVIRPNGSTVESSLNSINGIIDQVLQMLQSRIAVTSKVPDTLNPGCIAVVGSSIYIGGADGTPILVSDSPSDLEIGGLEDT